MRRRDVLISAVAFVVLAAMGVLILALVTDAESNGRDVLEESLVGEVQAVARSQNSRVASAFGSVQGLTQRAWELEADSEADAERLGELLELVGGTLRSGFYLTDASGTITQGVNFTDREAIGATLERPGIPALLASGPEVPGAYLPIADGGFTTDLPNIALVFPIRDQAGTTVRGLFVFESEVTADSDFNEEISELRRGETGEFIVHDANGRIIAANDPSTLAETVPAEIARSSEGLRDVDGVVVVVAEIPNAGWRLAFTQDRDEFEDGLTGPLQRVGTVAVIAFVVLGIVTSVALSRRLRAAREEQARLRKLNETQEEFISIVSHELRTPVAGVLGFLQTTIDHWDGMTDAERSSAVRRAASNARRLQGLTRDVLDSQSVEVGRMSYAMAPADLREEMTVAVEAAQALYPAQRLETTIDVASVPIEADVDRIQQVLTNLIDNAVRISPPDAPVELRLWIEDDRARLSVADHGPGLPPDMEERVFEKFVRGRSGSVTGTGLGLYIARQILEAHGGSISVRSTPGEGATFVLDLPLLAAPVPS